MIKYPPSTAPVFSSDHSDLTHLLINCLSPIGPKMHKHGATPAYSPQYPKPISDTLAMVFSVSQLTHDRPAVASSEISGMRPPSF